MAYELQQRARPGDRIVIEEHSPGELMHRDYMPPVATPATSHTTGTHVDRAKAFSIRTLGLSIVTGVSVWLVGSWAVELPLFSLGALVCMALAFLFVWLAAFWIDASRSPEGVAYFNAVTFRRYIEREQKARLGR